MHGFDRNRIWCAIVQQAMELTNWMQMIGFADHRARWWEPNCSGCNCSPSRHAWPAMLDEAASDYRFTHPGPTCSLQRWLVCSPTDRHDSNRQTRKDYPQPGQWNPAAPAAHEARYLKVTTSFSRIGPMTATDAVESRSA